MSDLAVLLLAGIAGGAVGTGLAGAIMDHVASAYARRWRSAAAYAQAALKDASSEIRRAIARFKGQDSLP